MGRRRELDVLAGAFERTECGRGAAVVVSGEAGVGKTRLLDEVVELAATRAAWTGCGSVDEFGLTRPCGPLVDACAADPPSGAEQFQVLEACIAAVEDRASDQRVVVALEDVHWADHGTLAGVRALARRAERLPILLVVTMRPWPVSAELAALVDDVGRRGHVLNLEPLDSDDVAELAADALGAPPGPHLREQLATTGGNPFLVLELLEALREEGAVVVDTDRAAADLSGPVVATGIHTTVLRRLAGLPADCLEIVQLAAVLGSTFDPADLGAVTGRSTAQLLGPIAVLRDAGIVEGRDDRLAFRHDLVRESVASDLPPALRRALHLDIGRTLARSYAPAVRVAAHLELGNAAAPELVPWMERAAHELAPSDPDAAVALLERASAIAPDASRPRLAVEHVDALLRASRPAEAQVLAEQSLGAAEPGTRATLRAQLARALLHQGRATEATEQLDAAVRSAPDSDPRHARWRADLATARLWSFDLDGAVSDAHLATTTGRQASDMAVVSSALAVRSRVCAFRAEFDEAIELGRAAVAADASSVDAAGRPAAFYLGLALLNADQVVDARTALQEGRSHAERDGIPRAMAAYHTAQAIYAFFTGAWDDVVVESDAARLLAEDLDLCAGLTQAEALDGLVALHRGDLASARAALTRARESLARRDGEGTESLIRLEAALHEADGDTARALQELTSCYDLAVDLGVASVRIWIGPELVRLVACRDDGARATLIADDLACIAGTAKTVSARAAARHAEGVVNRDPAAVLESVELLRTASRPLDLVLACDSAATVLVAAGRRDDAIAVLREGLAVCDELGARHDARLLSSQLRALGARRGVRGRRARPATGWASLTPTELDVARLVTDGLSNPEIGERLYVSRRTVATHLSHIFTKLGVRSRSQLAALAREEES